MEITARNGAKVWVNPDRVIAIEQIVDQELNYQTLVKLSVSSGDAMDFYCSDSYSEIVGKMKKALG